MKITEISSVEPEGPVEPTDIKMVPPKETMTVEVDLTGVHTDLAKKGVNEGFGELA